jgi:hypothetical protein
MTFDRLNVKWTTVFSATSASTLKIKLNADGKLYDSTTGDNSATDKSIAFAQEDETLVLASQAGDITVSVPVAGEYTLVVDFSNPNTWTCQVVSGATGPEEVKTLAYLLGIDDGINESGEWTFDNYLKLYNEDELTYAGVVNVNSKWGYTINLEKENWDDKYILGEGDASNGTLVLVSDADEKPNIPAPTPGVYLIDVSLKALTYNLITVGDQIYVVGLNDQWEFDIPLSAVAANSGVFSGNITINSVSSEYGFQIHIDNSWNHFFGGSDGELYYQGGNITDDTSLNPGTYQMTVDLINGTYEIK